MISEIILSGAGVGFMLFVVGRFIPNEKLNVWFFSAGQAVSKAGAGKLTKVAWEKIETFLQESGGVALKAFSRGLDSDDEKK